MRLNIRHVWHPTSLDQLIQLQKELPNRSLLSGGTLAIPSWHIGMAPEEVIYLPSIAELHKQGSDWCGAAATLAKIAATSHYPATLRQAANSIAGPGVRNLATLGGNLASSGDRCLAVALLALDAWVECLDPQDMTICRLPLKTFLPTSMQTIIRVGWTLPLHSYSSFTKFGMRATSGMNLATVAIHLHDTAKGMTCAIAVGATGVAPHRLSHTEHIWRVMAHQPELASAAAGQTARDEVQVQDEGLVPASYRRVVVGTLVERALLALLTQG